MHPLKKTAGPSVEDIARVVAIHDPVLRNCLITQAYCELGHAFAARAGAEWSHWLAVATWASRQAGDIIRGEQGWHVLRAHVDVPATVAHPVESLWRKLLRRGLLSPETRLGRLVRAMPGPLDAIEAAAEQVALGNLWVFEEMASAFAGWLAARDTETFIDTLKPGEPPEGQEHLRVAFRHYQASIQEPDARRRAELAYRADLEIAWQEQARLQDVIRASLEQPVIRAHELGWRVLGLLAPQWRIARAQVASVLGVLALPLHRFGLRIARLVITELLMTFRLPDGRVLCLSRGLTEPAVPLLREPEDPGLLDLLARIGCASGSDDCGTADWSDFRQRMHYIAHLFRCFQDQAQWFSRSPFTSRQIDSIRAGVLPEGPL
ncbi:MAG TPA: hypothetical protein VFL57_03425 [Bryobacteraceae bacterium]|nr:hypothetical protein [Bryobacteraceae bacterium]